MKGIAKRFGATAALRDVSFSVLSGQVHALVGENGAGKSTLMKVLSGALVPDSGAMHLCGRPFRPRNPMDARRAGVAMIYQELSLAPHLSVEENILLGLEHTSWGLVRARRSRAAALQALRRLGHSEISPEDRVGHLSVASQQLVEIARALAVSCRVLVLDEPTSSLNRDDSETLFRITRRLRDQGLAVVYISHFLEEVQRVADRYTVLRDGQTVGSGPVGRDSVEDIVRLMVGRQFKHLFPGSTRSPGSVALDVDRLSGIRLPADASFVLRRGEVLGIAGLVGAGRTDLLRSLYGLAPVKSGRIRLGVHTGPASPARRLRQGMGFLSEDRKGEGLAAGMSVSDNITLSCLGVFRRFGLLSPARQNATASRWGERLGIRCTGVTQSVSELSGGNQQKVALARLLQQDVDVLLLDEPTRGIDIASKAEVYRLADALAAQGKAILLVSSYLPELLGLCDRIAVMCRGTLGPARPVADVDEHELMLEATGRGTLP